jgi:hypothetical protein
MRRLVIAALLTSLCATVALTQKQPKSWNDWSQKEAQKILDDSPWGRTVTETDTSEMFFRPTNDTGTSRSSSVSGQRSVQGATNEAVHVNFHIRFFTAKPIRQALVRLMMLQQPKLPKETIERLNQFADLHSDQYIIVTVSFDSNDQRYSGPVMQAFGSATTDTLKNDTYLERKDGKKIFLSEYVPPGKDGFGARFIFPRQLDGQPFLTAQSGEVRFFSEFPSGGEINRRFNVADMMYDGKLEF